MGGSIKTGGGRCVISGMMILCISRHARAQGGSALGGQQGEVFVIAVQTMSGPCRIKITIPCRIKINILLIGFGHAGL